MDYAEALEIYRKKIQEEERRIEGEKSQIATIERRCEELHNKIMMVRGNILTENNVAYQGSCMQESINKSTNEKTKINAYCPRCGHYAGDDIFCRKCGTKVK